MYSGSTATSVELRSQGNYTTSRFTAHLGAALDLPQYSWTLLQDSAAAGVTIDTTMVLSRLVVSPEES
jgi:hypothetical protein